MQQPTDTQLVDQLCTLHVYLPEMIAEVQHGLRETSRQRLAALFERLAGLATGDTGQGQATHPPWPAHR